MFAHAVTRKPGKNFARGITTATTETPSYDLIIRQHETYTETLRSIGLEVIVLDPLPAHPDGYFVEDTAVVTPDVAVITIPGAKSRRGEADMIAPLLAEFRKIARIQPPGTLDGGDVLMVDSHFIVGISERTNAEGAQQLGEILERFGNTWTKVPVTFGLHFKSSVNRIGENTLLVSREYADFEELKQYEKIIVDENEKSACNTLWVNNHLITPKGFPSTRKKLETTGLDIVELDVSEVRKMDGGLTCMSLRF
ncbi:MAG: amidinotransferase [Deltaproteobacteria bacterium]|nr:MAG: amidinotransferase [Deltaproteobacteria bacterium]